MFVLLRTADNMYYIGGGHWSRIPKLFSSREAIIRGIETYLMDPDWGRRYEELTPRTVGATAYNNHAIRINGQKQAWHDFVERHEDIFGFFYPTYQLREVNMFELTERERGIFESGLYLLTSNPNIPEENKETLRSAARKLGLSTLE